MYMCKQITLISHFNNLQSNVNEDLRVLFNNCRLGLWCLTPLSTIFQLYRGVNQNTQSDKTTDLSQGIVNFIR